MISIHALLAESDDKSNKLAGQKSVFLSTLSLRRATLPCAKLFNGKAYFYPRSPCGERQPLKALYMIQSLFLSTLSLRRATFANFEGFYWWVISIHALLAESDAKLPKLIGKEKRFLSTLSLRRATIRSSEAVSKYMTFLSTLSLRRATRSIGTLRTVSVNFYPRSPCGERHRFIPRGQLPTAFLSTLSLRRATKPNKQ